MQYTTKSLFFLAIVLLLAFVVVYLVQSGQFSGNFFEGNMNCINSENAYKHLYKNKYSNTKSAEYPHPACKPN